MIVSELLRLFFAHVERHRAATTCKQYRSRLKSFGERFGTREAASLTPLEIEALYADASRKRNGEPKAPDSIRAWVICFHAFQSWCVVHKAIAESWIKLEKPRGRRRERLPSDEEIVRILEAADPSFGRIYRALLQSGCRPGELCGLQIGDWNRERGELVIKDHKTARKTGRDRLIPVGEKLQDILQEAIGDRSDGHVFLGPDGASWDSDSLGKSFRKIRDKLGLDPSLVVYSARHRFGTLVANTSGVHLAQRLLGHSSLVTTQIYIHPAQDDLRRAQDAIGKPTRNPPETSPKDEQTRPEGDTAPPGTAGGNVGYNEDAETKG